MTQPVSRQARGHRAPLRRAEIVTAALELVDAEGLSALSMRRLGARLGVEAMALYHHFRNKDDLVDALAAALCERLAPADLPLDLGWEERLTILWSRFRGLFAEHPNALPLLFTSRRLSTGHLDGTEQMLAALFDSGLDPRGVVDAWRALGSFVIGHLAVHWIFTQTPPPAGWMERTADLDDERHPSWRRVRPHLTRDWDEQFRSAFAVVLDGVRARAAARAAEVSGRAAGRSGRR